MVFVIIKYQHRAFVWLSCMVELNILCDYLNISHLTVQYTVQQNPLMYGFSGIESNTQLQ